MSIVSLVGGKSASCYVSATNMIKQGCQVVTDPQPGDIVYYEWNGNTAWNKYDHVGIVESGNKNSFYSLEGNTSNQMMRRERGVGRGYAVRFIRPKYASTAQKQAILKLAASQIGVKENPLGSNNVKYNTWYYGKSVSGSAYPWCQVFVCWVFTYVDSSDTSGSTGSSSNSSGGGAGSSSGGSSNSGSSSSKVTVDGEWGSGTTKLAQKILGTQVDGIISNQWAAYKSSHPGLVAQNANLGSWQWVSNPGTRYSPFISALQKKIGVKADGWLGPNTAKVLQKYLGVTQDGKIGTATVKAFQTKLNTGKL